MKKIVSFSLFFLILLFTLLCSTLICVASEDETQPESNIEFPDEQVTETILEEIMCYKKLHIVTESDNSMLTLMESADGVDFKQKQFDYKIQLNEDSYEYLYRNFSETTKFIKLVSSKETLISDIKISDCETWFNEFDTIDESLTEQFAVEQFSEPSSIDFGDHYLKKITTDEAFLEYEVLTNQKIILECYQTTPEKLLFFVSKDGAEYSEVFPTVTNEGNLWNIYFQSLPADTQLFKIVFSEADAISQYPVLGALRMYHGYEIHQDVPSQILIPLPEEKKNRTIELKAEIYDVYHHIFEEDEFIWEIGEVPGVYVLENQLIITDEAQEGNLSVVVTSVSDSNLKKDFIVVLKPRTALTISNIIGPDSVFYPTNGGIFRYEYQTTVLDEAGEALPASYITWELSEIIDGVTLNNQILEVTKPFHTVTLLAKCGSLTVSKTITAQMSDLFAMSLSSNQIQSLDSFYVTVQLSKPIANLYALQAELSFDASVIEFISAEAIPNGYQLTPQVQNGHCIFGFTKRTENGETFSGEIVRFRLKLLKKESTQVTLRNFVVLDDNLLQSEFQNLNLPTEIKLYIPLPPGGTSSGGGGGGGAGGNAFVGSTVIPELPPPQPAQKKQFFSDVPIDFWAEEAITHLYEKQIINGITQDLFAPQKMITRAEFIKMLSVCFQFYDETATCDFSDVSLNDWHYKYIASAARKGILNGYLGQAKPQQNISREEMFVLLYRILEIQPVSGDEDVFFDDVEISSWAKDAIYALKSHSLIQGDENGNISPKKQASRAEAAQLLFNYLMKEEEN